MAYQVSEEVVSEGQTETLNTIVAAQPNAHIICFDCTMEKDGVRGPFLFSMPKGDLVGLTTCQ